MIKWAKTDPGENAINGYLFEGLIKCMVWKDSQVSAFSVSFYGPDGRSKKLPESFDNIKQGQQAAERYLQTYIKNNFMPGPGRLGLTLTGPEGELLGQTYLDMLNPIFSMGDAYLIEAIVTQARMLAHLWLAEESKRKGNTK